MGSKYFLLFEDDYSAYRTVYFLKHKSKVFDGFVEYETLVKRQTENFIKILRCDNCREYINQKMKDYFRDHGIIMETSALYSHEQNGKSEREMRTITESARSMLYSKNLPLKLWVEVTNTAVHILNRTASKLANQETPYERWYKKKPKIDH